MDWMNWNRYQLEWIHLHWVRIHIQNDWIENSIWRIVYHYENYQLIDIHSQIIIHLNWVIFLIWNRLWLVLLHLHTTSTLLNQLNWMIFLLLNQLNLVVVHSILFMILYWVVWFDIDIDSILDLPKLKSIRLGDYSLRGDSNDDRKGRIDIPYDFMNTLTMKSTNEWLWIDNEIFLLSLPFLHLVHQTLRILDQLIWLVFIHDFMIMNRYSSSFWFQCFGI